MTIGIFIAQLNDSYQRIIWKGIREQAKKRGVGVVCFAGQRIDSPAASESAENIAYKLADPVNVDGLIILSTTLSIFRGASGIREMFADYPLSSVSLGLSIPGMTSLMVDGSKAVAELAEHLIQVHGRSKFALIAGPLGHLESDEREASFRQVLSRYGINIDERLVVRGSFLTDSGKTAAQALLSTGIQFDAVVCLNDRMALGAVKVFTQAGLRIPEDFSLTGFDDIDESLWGAPPLSTVHQPLSEVGRQAVDDLLQMLTGKNTENKVLDCLPVFRQSCGCPPSFNFLGNLSRFQNLVWNKRQKELSELFQSGQKEEFLRVLSDCLKQDNHNANLSEEWSSCLVNLRETLYPETIPSPYAGLLTAGQALIDATACREQANLRLNYEEQTETLRKLNAGLAGALDINRMLECLEEGLEHMGIKAGYLILFTSFRTNEDPNSKPWPERGRLLQLRGEAKSDFPIQELLPMTQTDAWKEQAWIVEPLVYQEEPLGYLVLDASLDNLSVYDTLRSQVSSTLKGALLMEQIQRHEQDLERAVKARTEELIVANRALRASIERRRRLEQEVQDISNRTMQKIGQDLHDDLCQHLAGVAVMASVAARQVKTGEAAKTMEKISLLLEDSVVRAKNIARGLYPPSLNIRGLAAAVEELVQYQTTPEGPEIQLQINTEIPILAPDQALQVYRIIQESLSNAVKHSQSELILVRLFMVSQELVAEVRDFGKGLSEVPNNKGMGMAIMDYRAESIGAHLEKYQLEPGLCVACRLFVEKKEN